MAASGEGGGSEMESASEPSLGPAYWAAKRGKEAKLLPDASSMSSSGTPLRRISSVSRATAAARSWRKRSAVPSWACRASVRAASAGDTTGVCAAAPHIPADAEEAWWDALADMARWRSNACSGVSPAPENCPAPAVAAEPALAWSME